MQIFKKIRQSTFIKNVSVIASGTLIGQGIVLATTPIITRFFTPTEIGYQGLLQSIAIMASVATTLKYERAIVVAKNESELTALLRLCWWITLLLVGLTLAGAFLFRSLEYFGLESLSWNSLWLIAPLLTFISVQQFLRFYLLRREEFNNISLQQIYQGGAKALFQVIVALLRGSWIFLLFGEIVGLVVGIFMTGKRMPKSHRREIFRFEFHQTWQAAKTYRDFALFSLPSAVIGTLASTLRIPMVLDLFGPEIGGCFVLTQRVVAGPLSLIGNSVGDIYHSRAARSLAAGTGEPKKLFWRTATGLLICGIIPYAILFFWAPAIFSFVFGENWRLAGEIAGIMAPLGLVQLVVSPVSRTIDVFGGQKLKFIFDGLTLAAFVILVYLCRQHSLSILTFSWWFNLVFVFLYLIYFLIIYFIVVNYPGRMTGLK